MGSGRGPREGDAIAKQVTSVVFVEKKEGAPPPPACPPIYTFLSFLKKNLSSNVN